MKFKQSLKFDYVNTGIKTSDIISLESKSTCDQVITNKDKVSDDNAYIKMNDLFKLIKKHGIDNPLVEEELLKISIEHKKLTTKVKNQANNINQLNAYVHMLKDNADESNSRFQHLLKNGLENYRYTSDKSED